jgi:hypothetical protein
MNRKACDELLSHSAEFIVVRLMVFLYYQSKKCYDLYDEGVITKDELLGDAMVNNYGLVALFREGEAKRLLKDIKLSQEIVRDVRWFSPFFLLFLLFSPSSLLSSFLLPSSSFSLLPPSFPFFPSSS